MVALATSYIIENDQAFKDALNRASEKVSDLRVAFKLIQDDWIKSNKAQFTLQGSGQYPPLSKKYAARKAVTHPGAPILVRSGRLRDSVARRAATADSIREIGKLSMVLGTRTPYGIFHQSDAPRRKIPQRKFLFIGPEAPRNAPSPITGRLQRWLSILEAETQRKLENV